MKIPSLESCLSPLAAHIAPHARPLPRMQRQSTKAKKEALLEQCLEAGAELMEDPVEVDLVGEEEDLDLMEDYRDMGAFCFTAERFPGREEVGFGRGHSDNVLNNLITGRAIL